MRLSRRGVNVDGVRVEGPEARRMLRAAFFEAARETGISTQGIRAVTMLIGGVIGGILVGSFMLWRGPRPGGYDWMILAAALVAAALLARFVARRVLWRVYRNEIRLAMQRLGFELCLECGYWLKGLPDGVTRCPECGTERRHLGA